MTLLPVCLQIVPQGYGMVVFRVFGSKEQGQLLCGGQIEELLNRLWVFIKLREVAGFEALPFGAVMPEPFPERRARRDVFQPMIVLQLLLGHASGPDPIDKNPDAVGLLN